MEKRQTDVVNASVRELEQASFARRVPLQLIRDATGVSSMAEASRQIGFVVRRIYFLSESTQGSSRGGHGNKRLRQCFICVTGSAMLRLEKGGERITFRLEGRNEAVQVDSGCWRELWDFAAGTVVLVLASEEHDEADELCGYDEFRAWEQKRTEVVPYIDLSRQGPELAGALEGALLDTLRDGQFIGGQEVARFEKAFADFCQVPDAIGVGNGLDALALALRARGIGPGDEVIIPAHTFIATALAVDSVGATPVLVDVEWDTGLIDVALLPAAITERTRAIIPVHLYGHPVDMDAVAAAVAGRNVFILEDVAQAHGALYKGRPCGSLGHAAGFSFYPTKNLGALGDGGAVTTADATLADRLRLLRNYGAAAKYRHELPGVNSRLDSMQAAILAQKLNRLDGWNSRRRALASRYLTALEGLEGLELPGVRPWVTPVWHVFAVRVPGRRDELARYLEARGIGTNIHYPVPMHQQRCYAGRWAGPFLVTERLSSTLLSLPLDPMHGDAEIERVIAAVRAFFDAS